MPLSKLVVRERQCPEPQVWDSPLLDRKEVAREREGRAWQSLSGHGQQLPSLGWHSPLQVGWSRENRAHRGSSSSSFNQPPS